MTSELLEGASFGDMNTVHSIRVDDQRRYEELSVNQRTQALGCVNASTSPLTDFVRTNCPARRRDN